MTLKVLRIKHYRWSQLMFDIVKNNYAKISTLIEFEPVIGKPGLYRDTSCLTVNWIEIFVDGKLRAFEVHEYQFFARLDILNAFEQCGRTTTELYQEVRKVEVEAKLKWLTMFDKKYFHEYIGHFDLAFLMEPEQLGDFDE